MFDIAIFKNKCVTGKYYKIVNVKKVDNNCIYIYIYKTCLD